MAVSSYCATAGLCDAPFWLDTDWLLSAFSLQLSEAVVRYAVFMAEGKNQPGPWEKLKNQIFLGSEAFVAGLQCNINADARLLEIPAIQRRPLPKPLAQLAEEHERDEAILRAYAGGGYSLKEIGDHFDCWPLVQTMDPRFAHVEFVDQNQQIERVGF